MKEALKNPMLWVLAFIAVILVIKFFPKKEKNETTEKSIDVKDNTAATIVAEESVK